MSAAFDRVNHLSLQLNFCDVGVGVGGVLLDVIAGFSDLIRISAMALGILALLIMFQIV